MIQRINQSVDNRVQLKPPQTPVEGSIQIGRATFSHQFPRMLMETMITKRDQKMFKDEMWLMTEFEDKSEIFRFIKKAQCERLIIIYTSLELDILKYIVPIQFEKLTLLNLGYNNILNIEALEFINAPTLNKISFKHNYLTHFSQVMNKVNFPNLQLLELSENFVTEIKLERWKNSKKPIEYRLYTLEKIIEIQNINFYAKLQFKQVNPDMLTFLYKYRYDFTEMNEKDTNKQSHILQLPVSIALSRYLYPF